MLCLPAGIIALINNNQAQAFDVRYDDACLPVGNVYNLSLPTNGGEGPSVAVPIQVLGDAERSLIVKLQSIPNATIQLVEDSTGPLTTPAAAVPGTEFVCQIAFTAPATLSRFPINVQYRLTRFWQNHRRYAKSVAVQQLRKDTLQDALNEDTGPCDPRETSESPTDGSEERVVPCGLRALSLFNDSYTLGRATGSATDAETFDVANDTIAWATDIETMYGATPQSDNFNTVPAVATGRTILPFNESAVNESNTNSAASEDVSGPLEGDQRFIVWMKPARLSTFTKLWGTIDDATIQEGDTLLLNVTNLFNTYAFQGQKSVRLSSDGFLGGGSLAWGVAFLAMMGVYFALAIAIFTLDAVATKRRTFGDIGATTWMRERPQDEDW